MPSARRIFPVPVAVEGKVAVVQTGFADAPEDVTIWPAEPADMALIPLVPLPINRPYCVRVVCPVPPLPTTSVPPSVIAPLVAVEGVNPVVPALNVVTSPLKLLGCVQLDTPAPSVVRT